MLGLVQVPFYATPLAYSTLCIRCLGIAAWSGPGYALTGKSILSYTHLLAFRCERVALTSVLASLQWVCRICVRAPPRGSPAEHLLLLSSPHGALVMCLPTYRPRKLG